MRYAGNITIYDDQGNVVFERDLTQDEMIETLLARTVQSPAPVDEDITVGIVAAPSRKRGRPAKTSQAWASSGFNPKNRAPEAAIAKGGCKTCGKKGHYAKTCPDKLGTSSIIRELPKPTKRDHGRVLNEAEFDIVKEGHLDDMTALQILNQLPDDIQLQHVNYAILSNDYERYVAHANAVAAH